MQSIASGQLATTAAAIYTRPQINSEGPLTQVCLSLENTGGSTETILITLLRANDSTQTQRRVFRCVLATNEQAEINGIPMGPGDALYGVTTDASVVDYILSVMSPSGDFTFTTYVFDATGAQKTSTSNTSSGAQTITSTSANALAVGANGTTNPVLSVNASASSVATGVTIVGAAAGSGVTLQAISSTGGEALKITGGASTASTAGGAVNIAGAAGGATSGAGGLVSLTGGAGTAGNSAGGLARVVGGAGQGTANGGAAQLTGGAGGAGATGNGGAATIVGGASSSTNGTGGAASLTGGVATGTGSGGLASLTGGAGTSTGVAGAASMDAGAANSGTGAACIIADANANATYLNRGPRAALQVGITLTALGSVQSSTPTSAQLLGGLLTQASGTGAGTITLPSGTALATACARTPVAGDSFDVMFANIGTQTLTVTGATGTTVAAGTNAGIVQSTCALLKFYCTGSNAFTIYTKL